MAEDGNTRLSDDIEGIKHHAGNAVRKTAGKAARKAGKQVARATTSLFARLAAMALPSLPIFAGVFIIICLLVIPSLLFGAFYNTDAKQKVEERTWDVGYQYSIIRSLANEKLEDRHEEVLNAIEDNVVQAEEDTINDPRNQNLTDYQEDYLRDRAYEYSISNAYAQPLTQGTIIQCLAAYQLQQEMTINAQIEMAEEAGDQEWKEYVERIGMMFSTEEFANRLSGLNDQLYQVTTDYGEVEISLPQDYVVPDMTGEGSVMTYKEAGAHHIQDKAVVAAPYAPNVSPDDATKHKTKSQRFLEPGSYGVYELQTLLVRIIDENPDGEIILGEETVNGQSVYYVERQYWVLVDTVEVTLDPAYVHYVISSVDTEMQNELLEPLIQGYYFPGMDLDDTMDGSDATLEEVWLDTCDSIAYAVFDRSYEKVKDMYAGSSYMAVDLTVMRRLERLWNYSTDGERNWILLEDITEMRKALLYQAVSLLGRIEYFPGGRYDEMGLNPDWGMMTEVTDPDSPDYGTMQPLGLDSMGFIQWAYRNASREGISDDSEDFVLNNEVDLSYEIPQGLLPGDLMFLWNNDKTEIEDILMFVGFGSNDSYDSFGKNEGDAIWIHCIAEDAGLFAEDKSGVYIESIDYTNPSSSSVYFETEPDEDGFYAVIPKNLYTDITGGLRPPTLTEIAQNRDNIKYAQFVRVADFDYEANPNVSGSIIVGDERVTEPSATNPWYFSNTNIFYASGYGMPNCTAYAWGRVCEYLGYVPDGWDACRGDAGSWWEQNINANVFQYGQEPMVGAVAVWGKYGGAGHVAFVERIEGDTIYVSESAWKGYMFNYVGLDINTMHYGSSYYFKGFIYASLPQP